MVTIKELSESIGVSKVAVTKWLERNGKKEYLEKVGNKYYIPDDIESSVRLYFADREPKKAEKRDSAPISENTLTEEIIGLLREQLEAKDREIDRLQTQVENLQSINADMVKAVRELNTLQAMQLAEPGTSEEPIKEDKDEPDLTETVSETPRKRSFFSWFRR